MKREDWPDWLRKFNDHLAAAPELPAEQMAQRIHEALEIAEIRKYATPESRFSFTLLGASEEDVATIRQHLTPFDNLIVEIRRDEMPGLDMHDLQQMRSQIDHCEECVNWVLKNYCRECDEFYIYGHDQNCRYNPHEHEKHQGHRTY